MISLTAPWALLGLLGIPLVIALHLFRRDLPTVRINALFLWTGPRAVGAMGRNPTPLRQRLSLWLEILVVVLVTLALVDPHIAKNRTAPHVVVVVDGHWRMGVIPPDKSRSVWQEAFSVMDEQLSRLPEHGVVTVVASGVQPRLLAGPAAPVAFARKELAAFIPEQPLHSLEPALVLAQDLGTHNGKATPMVICSDRDGFDKNVGLIARGVNVPNSGWAGMHQDPDGSLWARVVAWGGSATRVWSVKNHKGEPIAQGLVKANPSALVHIPAPTSAVTLTLNGPDSLACDDVMDIPYRMVQPVHVNLAVDADLRAGAALRRAVRVAGGVITQDNSQAYDLLIAPGATVAAPGSWRLSLISGTGSAVAGPFASRGGNTVVAGLDSNGLIIAGPGDPLDNEDPLWRAGEQVVVGQRRHPGRGREIILHANWDRSNLDRHPVFPAFVSAVLQHVRQFRPGPRERVLFPGQMGSAVLPPGTVGRLFGPGLDTTVLPDGEGMALIPALTPGQYTLTAGSASWALSVAMVDPQQADLRDATTVTRNVAGAGIINVPRSATASALWIICILSGIVAAWMARRKEAGP